MYEKTHIYLRLSCLALIFLTSTLIGCGSGSGNSSIDSMTESQVDESDSELDTNDPDSTQSADIDDGSSNADGANAFFGRLIIETYGSGEGTGAIVLGDFYRYDGNLDSLESNVSTLLFEDKCTVFGLASSGQSGGSSSSFSSVDAGEVIVLSSAAGTVASLIKTDEGSLSYLVDIPQLGPQRLSTFDVPGAEFPAFSGGTIPDSARLNVAAPVPGESIKADTVFSWTPTSFTDDYVSIVASSVTPEGDTFGFSCQAVDDGLFSLPAPEQATLGNDFVADFTTVISNRLFEERRGNVLMQVFVMVPEYF